MAAGFGAEPTINAAGAVTAGTTAADIRKIFGALYSPGLISGGAVKTSASAMTYSVSEGVAAIKMATGETVLAYWPAVNNLAPASSSVPRTDYIYAYQQTPSADSNSTVQVRIGSTFPTTRAVLLGKFTYKAGATSTGAGVRDATIDYAIPYGASRGELAWGVNTLNGTFGDTRTVIITKSLNLPTDRLVTFNFNTTVSAASSSRFSDTAYCEASYALKVDGQQVAYWRSPGLHQAWSTLYFQQRMNLSAGAHTVTVDRAREVGPGTPFQHYLNSNTPGSTLSIVDNGVIV